MRYLITVLAVFSAFPVLTVSGQNSVKEQDSLQSNTIISGFDFSSNTSTFGRFSGVSNQPSYSAYATYFTPFGLNAGISAIALNNSDTTASKFSYEYDLTLGYDLTLTKYLATSVNYTHFIYSANSNSVKSLYSDLFQLNLDFTLSKFYTTASVYYVTGTYNEVMTSLEAGYNFEFTDVLIKNSNFSISPSISAMAGNQEYYSEYAYKTYWYLYLYAQKYPDYTVNDLRTNSPRVLERIQNRPWRWKNFQKLDGDLVISSLFEAEKKFTLTSATFNLPVYYSVGNFMFNVSYSITFPLNLPSYLDDSPVQYISAGIAYSLDL